MREIKFRAWNIDKKRWETDYERCYLNEEGCCEIEFTNMYTSGLRRINAVVNLYTGLKDKNGVEIYEGDIVSDIESESKWVIVFGKYGWCIKHPKYDNGAQLINDILEELEIIGNIYENLELLNSEQNVQECDATKAK